jgi:hypothetical protein
VSGLVDDGRQLRVAGRSKRRASRSGVGRPLEAPSEPLTGDSHAALLEPAAAFAASLGFNVAFERTPNGASASTTMGRRWWSHHRDAGSGSTRDLTRARAEVMVDTVGYIVCAGVGLGLAIDGESIPYVAGWGEDRALNAVNQFAATIDPTARRIEMAIGIRPPAATA